MLCARLELRICDGFYFLNCEIVLMLHEKCNLIRLENVLCVMHLFNVRQNIRWEF